MKKSKDILLTKETPPRQVIEKHVTAKSLLCEGCILDLTCKDCSTIMPRQCVRKVFGKTQLFIFKKA